MTEDAKPLVSIDTSYLDHEIVRLETQIHHFERINQALENRIEALENAINKPDKKRGLFRRKQ